VLYLEYPRRSFGPGNGEPVKIDEIPAGEPRRIVRLERRQRPIRIKGPGAECLPYTIDLNFTQAIRVGIGKWNVVGDVPLAVFIELGQAGPGIDEVLRA